MILRILSLTVVAVALPLAALADAKADRDVLNRARVAYAKGNYTSAAEIYSSIKQDSDYYTTALEERAHTYGRAGEYNKALADSTTLFSPVFEKGLSAEAYFTAAITHLRLCQYKQVYEVLGKFKNNMRERIVALTDLSSGKASLALADAAHTLRSSKYNSLAYAKNVHLLPNLFHLDFIARAAIKKSDNAALTRRAAQLAKEDLKDISANTRKLHLVEAEIMQRLNMAENHKDDSRKRMGKFQRKDGQLIFPYNGEIWIDELDAYQVQSENCPKGEGV